MSDSRYTDLGLQPLAGARAGRRLKVSNPFDGSLLLEIEQADRDDLDAAYAKAAEVQPAWAALGPSARAAVLYKAVEVFDRRHEEIVDWIIRESGSTRLKAEIEWGGARDHPGVGVVPGTGARAHRRVRRAGQGKPGLPQRHRCGRGDQPVELPAAPDPAFHRPGPGAGQRGGGQAGQRHAGLRRTAAGADLRRPGCRPGCSAWWSAPAARSATPSSNTRCRAW